MVPVLWWSNYSSDQVGIMLGNAALQWPHQHHLLWSLHHKLLNRQKMCKGIKIITGYMDNHSLKHQRHNSLQDTFNPVLWSCLTAGIRNAGPGGERIMHLYITYSLSIELHQYQVRSTLHRIDISKAAVPDGVPGSYSGSVQTSLQMYLLIFKFLL